MKEQNDMRFDCKIGLEKESLRVNAEGRLAQTPHPFPNDERIDRDFCENQIEIITRPTDSPKEAYREIKMLHRYVIGELKSRGEYLWLFSNPPYIENDEEIPIAHYTGPLVYKEEYRRYLAQKYGKRKMLYSGIHFNFSFDDNLLQTWFAQSGAETFRFFKDTLYLHVAKWAVSYSWLIVYLTAASPLLDPSFFEKDAQQHQDRYASPRCSEIGYRNFFLPILDYAGLDGYVQSIEACVERKEIVVPSELYYPVRLKPRGANSLADLQREGVNHIELRMLDLNPLSDAGIFEEDLYFLHLLLLWFAQKEDFDFTAPMQKAAIEKMYRAALFDDLEIKMEAAAVLHEMQAYFGDGLPEDYRRSLAHQIEKVTVPGMRYAETIRDRFGEDYIKKGLELSKQAANTDCSFPME